MQKLIGALKGFHAGILAVCLLVNLDGIAVERGHNQHFILAVSIEISKGHIAGRILCQSFYGPLAAFFSRRCYLEDAVLGSHDTAHDAVLLYAAIAMILQQILLQRNQLDLVVLVDVA